MLFLLKMQRRLRPMDMFLFLFLIWPLPASDGLMDSYFWNSPAFIYETLHLSVHISHSLAVSLVDSSFSVFFLRVDVSHICNSLLNTYNWTAHLKLNYKIQFFIFSPIFLSLDVFISVKVAATWAVVQRWAPSLTFFPSLLTQYQLPGPVVFSPNPIYDQSSSSCCVPPVQNWFTAKAMSFNYFLHTTPELLF